jgi:hypothetical protein
MTELEQLRYDKGHTAGVVDAMRRDMAQAQHDLYVAHELNAQLQRDVAAIKDDQVWVRIPRCYCWDRVKARERSWWCSRAGL